MSKKTSTIETIWHSNSLVKQETIYINDKKNGTEKEWDDKGNLIRVSEFLDDLKEGKETLWKYPYIPKGVEDGGSKKLVKVSETFYKKGEKHGIEKLFIENIHNTLRDLNDEYSNPMIKEIPYKNGLKEGEEIIHFEYFEYLDSFDDLFDTEKAIIDTFDFPEEYPEEYQYQKGKKDLIHTLIEDIFMPPYYIHPYVYNQLNEKIKELGQKLNCVFKSHPGVNWDSLTNLNGLGDTLSFHYKKGNLIETELYLIFPEMPDLGIGQISARTSIRTSVKFEYKDGNLLSIFFKTVDEVDKNFEAINLKEVYFDSGQISKEILYNLDINYESTYTYKKDSETGEEITYYNPDGGDYYRFPVQEKYFKNGLVDKIIQYTNDDNKTLIKYEYDGDKLKQEIHEMYDRHNRKISEIYFDSNKKKIKERREI